MALASLLGVLSIVATLPALGGSAPADKNDTCPSPYPDLKHIQDSTIDSAFAREWPRQLSGTWYTIGAADRFQPPAFMCGRYNYSVPDDNGHTSATYLVKNSTDGKWKEYLLTGFALPEPGHYFETSLAALPAGKNPFDVQNAWPETVAHFGDTTDPSNTIWVRWGCSKPPLGDIQFTEVLSRKLPDNPDALTKALAHLSSINAPNIGNMAVTKHEDCNYPWQPELKNVVLVV